MLKLAGAFLVAVAFAGVGIFASSKIKREKAAVERLSDFVKLIKSRIELESKPLPDIFAESDYPPSALILQDISLAFENEDLPEDIKESVFSFFANLGKSFSKSELSLCSEIELKLENEIAKLSEDYQRKAPLYRSLWLIAGLTAAIILI